MPDQFSFTTHPKKITATGELAWGGDDGWDNDIDVTNGVRVIDGSITPDTAPESGISRWGFNGDAVDQWGNNDAIVTNASFYSDAEHGTVVSFTQSEEEYVEVPDTTSLRPRSFSISGWFRCPDTTEKWEIIAAKEYWNNNEGWALILTTGNDHTVEFIGPDITASTTEVNVVDGSWHHAIGTYDDTENVTRLFHNGSEVAMNTGVSLTHTTLPFHSGVRNDNTGDGLTDYSTIDVNDLRFYKKPVSATEASNIYTTGSIHG
jgi:hypothetical protein